MNSTKKIEFKAYDGTILRGLYYVPTEQNAPVIILSAGLTFLKEHFIDAFAERFQAAGFAALVYDHRNWGSSDGLPRNESNFFKQADDYSDAITYVTTLAPEIDPQRICVWGAGHSGGVVMPVAALDPRVKTVVTMVPFISGQVDSQYFPAGYLERARLERQEKVLSNRNSEPQYVPIFANTRDEAVSRPFENVIGVPEAFDFYETVRKRSEAAGSIWDNQITLQSLYYMSQFEPTTYIHRISPKPLLYVVAQHDKFIPLDRQLAAYGKAQEPKELVEIDSQHLDTYSGPIFEDNVKAQIEFLKRNL